VDKHKAIAALAASQANTLAARQSRRRDEVATLEERLRELASRSDDDAIIGQLQQKLMTIQANYHSFTDRYEKAMELQRAAQLQVNTLTLQMDATSQHLASELEKERQTNRVLESTIATLKQSDLRAKLKRLEAMATRIEALEDDAVQLHAKKRALERRVEELEAGVSTPSTAQTNRSKDSSTQQKAKWRQDNAALQSKLDQTLFEMDALKAKCSKLLTECNDKDAKIRDLAMQVDNLVLESQLNPAKYYEKDHMALQEAAQATIASLKALVQDKNVRIDELRRQLELARADFDAKQQAAHDDQERRNKRLYQDNHAYIGQLKDALDKIQHLEAQGGGQAVVAAREMHQGLMDQLKQVHMDVHVKEIATLQKVNHSLVCDVEAFEKGHQRQTKKVDGLTCEIQDVNQKYKRAMALVAKSKAALNSRDQSPGQLLKAAELRDQLDRCKAKLGAYASQVYTYHPRYGLS
ncbi:hypothetical protein DYB37_006925, partial [Aphanomyces astaci]